MFPQIAEVSSDVKPLIDMSTIDTTVVLVTITAVVTAMIALGVGSAGVQKAGQLVIKWVKKVFA